jgi:hypothetical protein
MAFNNRKQFNAGASRTVAAPAASIIMPFGASLEDLEKLYEKLKHLVRYDLVPKYFDNEVIRDMFFRNGELYTEKCYIEGLSLDGLMNIFNPIEENVQHAHWIGPDPIRQKKILCWFMGYAIQGENWVDSSRFTKRPSDPSKPPEKIFNLLHCIFSCLKHRFNDAINRSESNPAITVSHEFFELDNGDLDFDTHVKIRADREEFNDDNISKTIATINSKIDDEARDSQRKYVAEQAAHVANRKITIANNIKKLTVYHERLLKIATEINFPVTPLDPLLIEVYAEFSYDAMTSGITRLGVEDGKVIKCSLSEIEDEIKRDMGIPVDTCFAAHVVEKRMQNGEELKHEQAAKIASSNTAIGAGCM